MCCPENDMASFWWSPARGASPRSLPESARQAWVVAQSMDPEVGPPKVPGSENSPKDQKTNRLQGLIDLTALCSVPSLGKRKDSSGKTGNICTGFVAFFVVLCQWEFCGFDHCKM